MRKNYEQTLPIVTESVSIDGNAVGNAYASTALMAWTAATPRVHVKTLFDGGTAKGCTLPFRLHAEAISACARQV